MQKRKNQIRNVLIVLSNILLIVSLILVLVLKNNFGYALYWFIVPFLMVLTITIIQKWSVRGLNADFEESKVIQRSFDDTTAYALMFLAFIYLGILGINCFKEKIINNPYVIVGFFMVMVIYELMTYLAIYVAKRDTAKLLEKKYNSKKK